MQLPIKCGTRAETSAGLQLVARAGKLLRHDGGTTSRALSRWIEQTGGTGPPVIGWGECDGGPVGPHVIGGSHDTGN